MNSGVLALLIPIVAIVGGILLAAFKIHKEHGERNSDQEAELANMREQIAGLTERVKVLEELATDDVESLKREINNLKRA